MPYTVEASFTSFYDEINFGGDHRETANTRRDDIVSTLSKSFTIVESFSSGSIPKFTALKEHAEQVCIASAWLGSAHDRKISALI